MNRLNTLGDDYLELKTAYLSTETPHVIRRALDAHLQTLVISEQLTPEMLQLLQNSEISLTQMREHLLTFPPCCKSEEQLFEELSLLAEDFKVALSERIQSANLEETSNSHCQVELTICTDIDTNTGLIGFGFEFYITKPFIYEYFSISDEETYRDLTREKGFIAKFAILRLHKIMSDFKQQQSTTPTYCQPQISNVYNNYDMFGVTFKLDVETDTLEDQSVRPALLEEASTELLNMKDYFEARMKI